MRIERIGDATLYLGDCLEILPTLGRVDAVVTDPPYGIGASDYKRGGTQYGNSKAQCRTYDKMDWDKTPISSDLLGLILASGKWKIIFGGNYYALPPSSCWLVWDKLNGEGSGYADCELAWTNLKKAVRRIKWRWAGMLQQDMKNKEIRHHPTQKPVAVMRWCIEQLPAGCDTILDPFMGSGTTGVACAKMGRKFIGIELEPKYFDIACKRIEEAYKQGDMFIQPAAPEAKQEALL